MLDPRLNYLAAVVRAGSFTGAAASVGITQSAITRSIADLEKQIGFAIFHRTGRGTVLTEEGREFAERAARLLADAHELFDHPAGQQDPFAGRLRIGVCPASLEWSLIEPSAALLLRHPAVRFDISGASFERMVHLVRNGAVDVAVGFEAAFREFPDLRLEPVGAIDTLLFVRREHPVLGGGEVTIERLSDYQFISPSDSRPYGGSIRNLFGRHNSVWQEFIHVIDYFPTVRRIVATSNAVGIVERTYAQTPYFQERFVALEAIHLFDPTPICCAMRTRWEIKPAARAFVHAMRSHWPRPYTFAS